MNAAAIVILGIAAIAWLAPAARAFINRKPRIGIISLATGPAAIAMYAQYKDPNVAMAAIMALVAAGSFLWRHAGK